MGFTKLVSADVYRKTPPATNWGDPVYTKIGSVTGSKQPVGYLDRPQSSQLSKAAKDVWFFYDMSIDLIEFDQLMLDGKKYYISGVERYDSGILPHIEVYTVDSPLG